MFAFMWSTFCIIMGVVLFLLIPFFAFMAFVFIYTTPFMIWRACVLPAYQLKKYNNYGIFKTLKDTTKFYFQLLRFKKPTFD